MVKPIIAFDHRLWKPRDLSWNPYIATAALMETTWASLAYNYAYNDKLVVYGQGEDNIIIEPEKIDLDTLYNHAVGLSLGVFTINAPHEVPCKRLICNCKTH